MKNLRNKMLSGVSWKVIAQIVTQAIQLVVTVILARLLTPRDFGLAAMVIILTNFAAVVSSLGRAAIIQKAEVSQELLSSVFWLNVLVGVLLTLIMIACAPFMALAYGEPSLFWLTIFFSSTFIINSFGITHNSLLQREIDFRSFAVMDIVAYAIAGVAALFAAYIGLGVWSLVVQSVVFSLVCIYFFWTRSPWRPGFYFRWRAIREIMDFSVNTLLADMLVYWVRNVDNLLIGLFLGSGPLGIYSRAYAVMLIPINRVARVLSDVMFSSLSKIQDERAYVKRVFLKMTRAVALITFPMMLGVLATAKSFVFCLFGPQWSEMVPVLKVLCLIGLIQSVMMFTRNIYLSQGKASVLLRVELPLQLIQVLGIVVGLKWGILGVSIGYAAASIIVSYPSLFFAGRLIELSCWEYLVNLFGVMGCAAAMAAGVWYLGQLLPQGLASPVALAIEVCFGALVYGGLLHALRVEAYVEVKAMLLDRFGAMLKPAAAAP